MRSEKITSLQLHLHYPAGEVVETRCLEDVGCGIYPCYYLRYKDKIKVSTSVTSLIFDSQEIQLNPDFKPPDFIKQRSKQNLASNTSDLFKKLVKHFTLGLFPDHLRTENGWYEMWETIDKRVKKLRPFEKITPGYTTVTFKPDFTIYDKKIIVTRTVNHMQKFVYNVEKDFPDYDHIVMTGGNDSQLISLISKLNDEKWHIFSAEPNYTLVKEFIEENDINVNKIFRHDNQNEETIEDFTRKVICGDMYSNPQDLRWLPSLKKIAEEFNHNCVFWTGTAADAIYSFHKEFHNNSKEDYFKVHMSRVSTWQGNSIQTSKNFVGCPFLSPYHSKEIWEELYQHLDPSIITKDTDLRKEIGERLFGKPVKWPDKNPGPAAYIYNFEIDLYEVYLRYIKNGLLKRTGK